MSLEAVGTFFLVLVFFATAIDEKGALKAIAGFGIGLTITIGILVAGPLTGAALNPARWLGPALWDLTQHGDIFQYHAPYWIGPISGALLAGWLYTALILPPEVEQRAAVGPPATARTAAASALSRAKK